MRILNKRFQKNVYIANETYFGSGEYLDPIKFKMLVSPMREGINIGAGVEMQYNTVELKVESNVKGVEDITQNSKVWVNVEPNEDKFGRDYNFEVIGKRINTTGFITSIGCRSTKANVL